MTSGSQQAVLVTGGAGYIGSHTCKAMAARGLLPVTYDNLSYGHRWAVQWGPLVHGDLADEALLERTLKQYSISAVIHFAAYAYVGESMSDPGKYFDNNVGNTLKLLQVMRRVGIDRLVFSSTCATYGEPVSIPITESHPQAPVNPYGESKLFVEKALRWYKQAHGLRAMSLRYFNAAGADPDTQIGEAHDPETHLIPLVIEAAMGKRPSIDILGTDYPTPDGTAIRDYIHVSDLADAHVAALQALGDAGAPAAVNLGTGTGYSVRQVIAAVEAQGGVRVPAREAPRRAGDPPELVADPSAAHAALQWEPSRSSLETIVRTAWQWHETAPPASAETAPASAVASV